MQKIISDLLAIGSDKNLGDRMKYFRSPLVFCV